MTKKDNFNNPELDFYIGDEATANKSTHDISYLLKSGQI